MEAVQQGEADLSFAPTISFKLLWQQTDLLSQLVHWLRRLGSGNLYVTDKSKEDNTSFLNTFTFKSIKHGKGFLSDNTCSSNLN